MIDKCMRKQCPKCRENVRVRLTEHGKTPDEMMIPCDGSRMLVEDDSALLDLISDLADPDPCWFDHHGYCQAHGWMAKEPPCPHGRAAKILGREAPDQNVVPW